MEDFKGFDGIVSDFEGSARVGSSLAKASRKGITPGSIQPKGVFEPSWENFSGFYDSAGIRNRHLYSMNFHVLREVAQKVAIIGAIHNVRLSQMRPFAMRSTDDDRAGYRVKLKDQDTTPSKSQEKVMKQIEEFFLHTGFTDFEGAKDRKDRFGQFVDKTVRESLTIDQNAYSLQRDRSGRLIAFHTLDGATIYPVLKDRPYLDDASIAYVQKIQGRVVETFTDDDIIFHFMNARADVRHNAFGYSNIEQAIDTVTGWLYGMSYNKEFFNSSAQPKGFFSFDPKEPIDPKFMNELQRDWIAMFRGIKGAWRTPFLQYNAKWNQVAPTNRDMEYNQYIQFLSALLCAVYKIDPTELGLKFNQSATISVGGGGRQDQMSKVSHDRGMQDLLGFVADICNRIMEKQDGWEEYKFEFTGKEIKDKEKEIELERKKVETRRTLNELRAEHDDPPVPNGDIVLNPQYIQYIQGKEGMEMGGEGGDIASFLGGGGDTDAAIDEGMTSAFKSRALGRARDGRIILKTRV